MATDGIDNGIGRYSSRQTDLRETVLRKHLKCASRYHRIAGYFTSSLFELAGEDLIAIPDVRIVCNADVSEEDLLVARGDRVSGPGTAELIGRLDAHAGVDALLHRTRYAKLRAFLDAHPDGIRVAPSERCGFVHGKAGVLERTDGYRLGFIGSMNETRAGWQQHYEILWSDDSTAGVEWIQSEFDWLWERAVPLPQAVIKEMRRRTHRVEIELDEVDSDEDVAPAALVEAPLYREGFSLSPWQRAFVSEALNHARWFGVTRLLLADEVGLGKTLSLATATLALALKAEQSERSQRRRPIAILAPATLTGQWQTELMDKLAVPTARWDNRQKAWTDPEGHVISPRGPDQIARCPYRIGIISTGLITQGSTEATHLARMQFGVLVLDESHKARTGQTPSGGAGEPNRLLAFMLEAAARSEHVLLGTATPMQTQVEDIWDQLRMLHAGAQRFVLGHDYSPWQTPEITRPLLTGDDRCPSAERAWKHLKSPLPPMDASEEPEFRRLISSIRLELGLGDRDFETNTPFAGLPLDVREDLEALIATERQGASFFQRHNPIVRHVVLRKRRELEDRGLLQRVDVRLHPDEGHGVEPSGYYRLFEGEALRTSAAFDSAYEAALAFGKAYGKRKQSAGFLTNLLCQRICSSAHAAHCTATALLRGEVIEDELSDASGESTLTAEEKSALSSLLDALDQIQTEDPKLQAIQHYLLEESWIGHGAIIFSQYYDTAAWVARALAKVLPNEPIGLYAGAGRSRLLVGDRETSVDRESLKDQVQRREIRLMIATDAACEGLNLQKLGALINVDLPWNPIKLEQRIGRIKRYGQTRPTVDMLNLVYQGTVDESIYERLSERMKARYEIFGSLPDTIDDEWVESIESITEALDQRFDAEASLNGFDLRYNTTLEADDDAWRDCERVLSPAALQNILRSGW